MREVRERRRLTREQLAERCKALGAEAITAAVISDIETGRKPKDGPRRRMVTVEELLALAAALNCPPVSLLVSPDDSEQPYAVTTMVRADGSEVRAWIRGVHPLIDDGELLGWDPREFSAELPLNEWYVPGAVRPDNSVIGPVQGRWQPRKQGDDDGPR